jgi:hypothetical protein
MTPTPAQRRELLTAIENDGRIQPRAGAGASRLRAALLANGWVKGGYVTDAGRHAVNEETRP